MSGHPIDPATGRAVLGGLARRPRRYVLVESERSGAVAHLVDLNAPARRGPLCRMLTIRAVVPSTRRRVCRVCERIAQDGAQ